MHVAVVRVGYLNTGSGHGAMSERDISGWTMVIRDSLGNRRAVLDSIASLARYFLLVVWHHRPVGLSLIRALPRKALVCLFQ